MAGSRGGKRLGAGRKPGSQSRATREQKATLSELARAQTKTALATLARVAAKGVSESAQVAAAIAILDRGYGKPMQGHEHSGPHGAPIPVADLSRVSDEQLAALESVFGPLAGSGRDDGGDPHGASPTGG
ncbi:hypothetical protein [Methylobacterium brachiatum]|uniref:hypothetical protein n=1 Tax=Methylobacterium brachiatum TaxID=269660 RepID=UPI00197C9DAC|nr:hypothetical protein [Methylobacterium brachiatum]